ncbi:MAG: histidinol dehydrogenase, partial [Chloroflexi bacterium]|nr:histidinol dehydrogenase [Chloroflexota bacterium]
MTTAQPRPLAPASLRRVRLGELDAAARTTIVERSMTSTPEVREAVRTIMEGVARGGDEALRDANQRFGGGLPADAQGPAPLTLDRATLRAARDALPAGLRDALSHMARNI